jgi:hypothetical protein
MADTYKVLGQLAPPATTLAVLYTAPSGVQTQVSLLTVCNRSATPTTFRISVAVGGAPDSGQQYLYYDSTIGANETKSVGVGLTLRNDDVIRVQAGSDNLTFNAFGVEVS